MSEAERGENATLFPVPVGERLRAARERHGLSLADVAARTRVPLRHLEAIETADYAALPSTTYAVGFVRAYARTVGEDEVALARDARGEVSQVERPASQYQPYEIADPARVPSRALVIVAAGLGLAIVVLAALWFATGLRFGGGGPAAVTPPVAVAVPSATPSAAPARAANGQVTIATNDSDVWMRVYDAQNKTLYFGTMKPGEKFDVPPDADRPMINVGRPDRLTITLNGAAVAPLGDGKRAIKDVPVGAAALAARGTGQPAPTPSASAGGVSQDVPPAFSRSAPRRETPRRRERPAASPSPSGPENLVPKSFATDTPAPAPSPTT